MNVEYKKVMQMMDNNTTAYDRMVGKIIFGLSPEDIDKMLKLTDRATNELVYTLDNNPLDEDSILRLVAAETKELHSEEKFNLWRVLLGVGAIIKKDENEYVVLTQYKELVNEVLDRLKSGDDIKSIEFYIVTILGKKESPFDVMFNQDSIYKNTVYDVLARTIDKRILRNLPEGALTPNPEVTASGILVASELFLRGMDDNGFFQSTKFQHSRARDVEDIAKKQVRNFELTLEIDSSGDNSASKRVEILLEFLDNSPQVPEEYREFIKKHILEIYSELGIQ